MRSHGICRHDPPSCPQLFRNRKLVILLLLLEAPSNEWQALVPAFAHQDKLAFSMLQDSISEVVSGIGEVRHDGPISGFPEAEELIVCSGELVSVW